MTLLQCAEEAMRRIGISEAEIVMRIAMAEMRGGALHQEVPQEECEVAIRHYQKSFALNFGASPAEIINN